MLALVELKRLKAKLRRGDATEAEQERYRELAIQKVDQPARHQVRGLSITDSSHSNDSIASHPHETIGVKRKFEPAPSLFETDPSVGSSQGERMEVPRCVSHEPTSQSSSAQGEILLQTPRKAPSVTSRLLSPLSAENPSPLLAALRASKATRGQQQHLVKALHDSPTTSRMLSRVTSSRAGLSSELSVPVGPAQCQHGGHQSHSVDGQPSADHTTAGMQYSAAMLSQALPPTMTAESFGSNTNMSATHLLRRFGNPHRRVVHQMLREQHERILNEMKRNARQSSTASRSGVDAGGGKGDAEAIP
jgi:hypothetical protein